jgi:hypothetical protein
VLGAGSIGDLAQKHGLDAPLSRRVVALIKQAEAAGSGPPNLTPRCVEPVSRRGRPSFRIVRHQTPICRV